LAVVRTIIRVFGLVCIGLALLLGLFALFGWTVSDDTGGRVIAGVLAGVAVLLALIGVRRLRHQDQDRSTLSPAPQAPSAPGHTGVRYEDFRWGDPPPSRKQFGYAMSLGAHVRHGMTKWMMSDAIDEAIEHQRSAEPPTKEQLRRIKEYHGVLPRAVTRGEAKRIIDFLEDHILPCPYCGIQVMASDDACCACGRSLRAMRIPIKL